MSDNYDEWEDKVEAWEVHYDFHERKDYPGLVAYCESQHQEVPDDLYAAERLAQAYVLNRQFHEAIHFCGTLHPEYSTISMFQHHILDALFALGKSENDFSWRKPPAIVRLSSEVGDQCHEFLRRKRKPRPVRDLLHQIWTGDYIVFTDSELLEHLRADARFVIFDDAPYGAEVKLAPKRKSITIA